MYEALGSVSLMGGGGDLLSQATVAHTEWCTQLLRRLRQEDHLSPKVGLRLDNIVRPCLRKN